MDNQSISYTTWNCTYNVVFIPKYRRKIMYGEVKVEVGEILRKLCKMKQIPLIEGRFAWIMPICIWLYRRS